MLGSLSWVPSKAPTVMHLELENCIWWMGAILVISMQHFMVPADGGGLIKPIKSPWLMHLLSVVCVFLGGIGIGKISVMLDSYCDRCYCSVVYLSNCLSVCLSVCGTASW